MKRTANSVVCTFLVALAMVWAVRPGRAHASVIVNRAPEASTIVEVFVTEHGAVLEFEGVHGAPRKDILVAATPGRAVLESEESVTDRKVTAAYRFSRRPNSLTLSAPEGSTEEEWGFVLYHLGLPAADLHHLVGEQTIDLNWDDPWRSRFRNSRLRRQYDSPLGVFLYVEPHAVRAEVVVRLFELQEWTDLGLNGRSVMPAELADVVKQRAVEYLGEHFALRLDGVAVRPEFDRADFLRRRLRGSAVIDLPEAQDLRTAILGVSYVLALPEAPNSVELEWTLFGDGVARVAGSITDDVVSVPRTLSRDENVLSWRRSRPAETSGTDAVRLPYPPAGRDVWLGVAMLSVLVLFAAAWRLFRGYRNGAPVKRGHVAAAFCGAGLIVYAAHQFSAPPLDQREAERVVEHLLAGVYSGFDYRAEEAVYDTLARYVAGDLLRKTYLETRLSLEIEELGGARNRVREVQVMDARDLKHTGRGGFQLYCIWTATGSVGHWGHVHERRNQYEAVISVEAIGGDWKITGLEVLNESRLSLDLAVRPPHPRVSQQHADIADS